MRGIVCAISLFQANRNMFRFTAVIWWGTEMDVRQIFSRPLLRNLIAYVFPDVAYRHGWCCKGIRDGLNDEWGHVCICRALVLICSHVLPSESSYLPCVDGHGSRKCYKWVEIQYAWKTIVKSSKAQKILHIFYDPVTNMSKRHSKKQFDELGMRLAVLFS